MLTAHVYLALANWQTAERALLQDARFHILGGSDDGKVALLETERLSPDLLVADAALAGIDGKALLTLLRQRIAPPRTLYLSRFAAETLPESDEMLFWPADEAALLTAVASVAALPAPGLARHHEPLRLQIASDFLRALEMPSTLKGFAAAAQGAALCACAPWVLSDKQGLLYPLLANKLGTTPAAVERAIRVAVEHTWLHGNLNAIQRLFGLAVDAERGKPTNAEFLSQLAEHVRREGQKQLTGGNPVAKT